VQYEKFHEKLGGLIQDLSPPGLYYEGGKKSDLANSWKFIKDLVKDYVDIKKKYGLLERQIVDL
jgi:hypothetical protein